MQKYKKVQVPGKSWSEFVPDPDGTWYKDSSGEYKYAKPGWSTDNTSGTIQDSPFSSESSQSLPGSGYMPEYDVTLQKLQQELAAQLEQQKAELMSQQELKNFMREKQGELLEEQRTQREAAASKYQQVIRPAFERTVADVQAIASQGALSTEAALQADEGYQTAMNTIRRAAAGKDIADAGIAAREAGGARGETLRGVGDITKQLAMSTQQFAAPLILQKNLEAQIRPFQTEAQLANIAASVAETQQAGVAGQAGSLAGLVRAEAAPSGVLAGLYGQNAGAYAGVPGSLEAIAAGNIDFGASLWGPTSFGAGVSTGLSWTGDKK